MGVADCIQKSIEKYVSAEIVHLALYGTLCENRGIFLGFLLKQN